MSPSNLEILAYEETALATLALDMHGNSGLRVLVGGLGLGYTAHAAIQSGKVEDLVVLELFAEVVAWMNDGLLPLSRQLPADPRLTMRVADFFQVMRTAAAEAFDAILVDIDHAPDQLLDEVRAEPVSFVNHLVDEEITDRIFLAR